jgi:hypothetical protein
MTGKKRLLYRIEIKKNFLCISVKSNVRIKIDREFYHGIIYIANTSCWN